jgi:hypothetical protein
VKVAAQLPLGLEWCQRWRGHQHSWRHVSEGGFNCRHYSVELCVESEARPFVVQQHYSGSFPAARRCLGLYRGGELQGAAVLSVPTNPATLSSAFPGQPLDELAELGRFVLLDDVPAPAETWMIARVLELAAREHIHGLVAFSDPLPRTTVEGQIVFPGHIGHIYKASSARYCGRSRPRTLRILPDGRVFSERSIAKILSRDCGRAYAEGILVSFGARPMLAGEDARAWLREAMATAGVRELVHPGNHRYVFTSRQRRRYITVGLPVLPYPERAA